jgi:hypothetical protein
MRQASKLHISKRTRSFYSIGQKEEVVKYAKLHGKHRMAAHFKLDKSMVG